METSKNRRDVINALTKMMKARPDDVIKIALADTDDGYFDIDKCDLTLVSEIKRSPQGAIEVKLIDRIAVIDRLIELTKEESGSGTAEGIIGAINGAASKSWSDEN